MKYVMYVRANGECKNQSEVKGADENSCHRGIDIKDAESDVTTCDCAASAANLSVNTRSSETMRISSRPKGCVLGRGC